MERWAKYKDNIINMTQASVFNVRRVSKDMLQYEISADKKKPWILSVEHTSLDAFASKPEAMGVAEDIIKGKHDIKMD